MAFRVYLSHSVAPHELGAVYGIAELAARKDMEPIVSDRLWAADAPPARIIQALKGINAFVAIATSSGHHLEWLNSELSAAVGLGLSQGAIVSAVDAGVEPPQTGKVLRIDRANLAETITKVSAALDQLQLERNQKNLVQRCGPSRELLGERDGRVTCSSGVTISSSREASSRHPSGQKRVSARRRVARTTPCFINHARRWRGSSERDSVKKTSMPRSSGG